MNNIYSILNQLLQFFLGRAVNTINKLQVNIDNAYSRLKSVEDKYLNQFKKNGVASISGEGALWFLRKDIEAARYYCTGGREGYSVSDRVQDVQLLQQVDPWFKMVQEKLKQVEKMVAEMEKAKGYEFIRLVDNNIIYKELSTGQELSAAVSNNV